MTCCVFYANSCNGGRVTQSFWPKQTFFPKQIWNISAERATEGHAKRQAAAVERREKVQAAYVDDFFGAVVAFLAFHPNHGLLGERLAHAVTRHAPPVGSGTVVPLAPPEQLHGNRRLILRGARLRRDPHRPDLADGLQVSEA